MSVKNNQIYNNIISLGFFCSVAQELDSLGLRNASYPFDWLISDFSGVIAVIDNHFKDFLSYESLAQMKVNPKYYINTKYALQFYHDFNAYDPLKKQLRGVQKKYSRRINRFYHNIEYPTLFVRYIQDMNECKWIEENFDYISKLLKSFNNNNEIVFIANNDITSEKLNLFLVEKDKDDTVARKPFSKSDELVSYFQNINYVNFDTSPLRTIRKRFIKLLRNWKQVLFRLKNKDDIYVHEKQI